MINQCQYAFLLEMAEKAAAFGDEAMERAGRAAVRGQMGRPCGIHGRGPWDHGAIAGDLSNTNRQPMAPKTKILWDIMGKISWVEQWVNWDMAGTFP